MIDKFRNSTALLVPGLLIGLVVVPPPTRRLFQSEIRNLKSQVG